MEGGTLNLPSSLPALNEATTFNTNGKDYATGVSIDLSELTYYPTMPMPQFNNGSGSNIINITENNSRTTFEELDGNRKNIEYITTPENPTPTPLMRSIVAKKSGETRDVTTSNIVGYVNVNIPPPSISSTIKNNGYYKFNSDWNGLIEGTQQDHELDINVKPILQNKTITIDSIESNQSTVIQKNADYNPLIPVLSSLDYNNGEIVITGSYWSGNSWVNNYNGIIRLFNERTDDYINMQYPEQDLIAVVSFREPKVVKKLITNVWKDPTILLQVCDDISNPEWRTIKEKYCDLGTDNYFHTYEIEIDNDTAYNYYRIYWRGYGYGVETTNLYDYVSDFYGLNKITIVNNTDSKIYKGYNNNNKYSITQTGDGTITIPTDYQALGEIKYNVNVPTTLVDNADVDSQNNNVISTNGTFTIPSGKTGWNSFSVNVPQSQQTKINFKYVKAGEQTVSLSELTYTQREKDIALPSNKIIFYMKKIESDSWVLSLYKNGNSSRDFYLSNGYYYHVFNDEIIYLCDNNLNNIGGFYDPSNDAAATTFYLYENCFNFLFN